MPVCINKTRQHNTATGLLLNSHHDRVRRTCRARHHQLRKPGSGRCDHGTTATVDLAIVIPFTSMFSGTTLSIDLPEIKGIEASPFRLALMRERLDRNWTRIACSPAARTSSPTGRKRRLNLKCRSAFGLKNV
jgi:hypothetical protein